MGLSTTPRTWVAGETVVAAMLNTEIRDAIAGIEAGWANYTPTWTASGTAPAIGNGVQQAAFMQIGHTTQYRIVLSFGSTTTFGTGIYSFALPVAARAGAGIVHGVVRGFNSGVGIFSGFALSNTGGATISLSLPTSAANCSLVDVGQLVPWTLKSGDGLTVVGTYEAA